MMGRPDEIGLFYYGGKGMRTETGIVDVCHAWHGEVCHGIQTLQLG